MSELIFCPEEPQSSLSEQDLLSSFNRGEKKPEKIESEMSVDEIADFVSNRLIDLIRMDFEETKQNLLSPKI